MVLFPSHPGMFLNNNEIVFYICCFLFITEFIKLGNISIFYINYAFFKYKFINILKIKINDYVGTIIFLHITSFKHIFR